MRREDDLSKKYEYEVLSDFFKERLFTPKV
jgi:hypothetical protein